MNIKEKFNNLFKYPAFYLLSLSGWIGIIFYLIVFYLIHVIKLYGTGLPIIFLFFIFSSLFLILLCLSIFLYTYCQIKDITIKKTTILNNKLIRILTTIGIIGFVSFIGLILLFFFLTLFLK